MNVKKVVYISTASNISGATLALLEIIEQVKRRGIEPIVITASRGELEDQLRQRDVKFYKVLYFSWLVRDGELDSLVGKLKWKVKDLLCKYSEGRIKKILKSEKPDVLHINTGISPVGIKSAKKLEIPVVWHIRELPREMFNRIPFDKEYEKSSLRAVDRVVPISDYMYKAYCDKTPNNIERVYDGVVTDGFEKLRTKELFEDEVVRLSLCGYNAFKGHEEAIRAVAYIRKKSITQIRLCFWGHIEENYERYLKCLVGELELEDYVSFCGYTSNMALEWANSDIALMCSDGECFGRATVEAMATGALVIGSDKGATIEILAEDRGILYEKGNAENLAEKILWALANKNEARNIAESGKKYICEGEFSIDKHVDNLVRIYQDVSKK